jgi:hypothetical protein
MQEEKIQERSLEEHHNILPVNDMLICSGTVPMGIPAGGATVRQVTIWLPAFVGDPSVNVTVFSQTSPGNVFGVWDIKVNRVGKQTQIIVSAINVEKGHKVPYLYYCSYVVIGRAIVADEAE